MARRRKRKYYYYNNSRRRSTDPQFSPVGLDLAPETKRGIGIILFLAVAVVSGLSVLNLAGSFGTHVTQVLRLLFGSAAFLAPLICLGAAASLFVGVKVFSEDGKTEEKGSGLARVYFGSALFVLALTGVMHVFTFRSDSSAVWDLAKSGTGGGYLGALSSFALFSLMGFTATAVVLFALMVVALMIAFDLSLHGIFRTILGWLRSDKSKTDAGKELPVQGLGKIKINTMESSGFAKAAVSADEPPVAEAARPAIRTVINVPKIGKVSDSSKDGVGIKSPRRYSKGEWKLPPTDLLEESSTEITNDNIEANVLIIKKTLEDFGVVVEMGEVNVGPTVTQYTVRPAVGVRLAQIGALQNDLALALAAPTIRIEAPIPGKSLVGIEVPNPTFAVVRLRELIESDDFSKHPSSLAFVLGRDVAGHPMIADLEKMPHLLVAGTTGSGKTVCLNTVIASLLYRNSPSELRLIVIDPKRVDLTIYSGIPHLLTPVVTDHKQAINALRWAVAEMDRRYNVLSESGKRNIQEYDSTAEEPMPYIVIVVDELAQLMSLAKNEVETTVVRLAQMARAVGIHLVLATQRPSVDVITGLIKANISSRIAFMVASQVDSRTILDMAGAENLLGKGDMLYSTAELPLPKRIQSAFISTKELQRVLMFLKDQAGEVDYQEEIVQKPQRLPGMSGGSGDDAEDEDAINAAIEEIRRSRKASATLLQRRLSIGYAKAARILDVLEERGMIGPSNGAKPREIYMENEDRIPE